MTVTIGCLILHERYKRRVENYLSLTKELSNESIETRETVINGIQAERPTSPNQRESEMARNRSKSSLPSQESQCSSSTAVPDIEDLFASNDCNDHGKRSNDMCSSSFSCSGQSRQQCQEIVRDYRQQQQAAFLEFYNDIQSVRHTAFLILLICSMFVVS